MAVLTEKINQALLTVEKHLPEEARIIRQEVESILSRTLSLLESGREDITERKRLIDDIKLAQAMKTLVLDERENKLSEMEKRLQRRIEMVNKIKDGQVI